MKKKIIIIVIIIMLLIGLTSLIIFNNSRKEKSNKSNIKIVETELSNEDSKNSEEETSEQNDNISNNTNTAEKSIKEETKKQSSINTITNKEIDNSSTDTNVSDNSNLIIEDKIETPKNNVEERYVGVPYPNDLDYSFHNGVIEYNTYNDCYNNGINISFNYEAEVRNFWCVPIRDSQATVLGYYLYIETYSGENGNKYKN